MSADQSGVFSAQPRDAAEPYALPSAGSPYRDPCKPIDVEGPSRLPIAWGHPYTPPSAADHATRHNALAALVKATRSLSTDDVEALIAIALRLAPKETR